MNTVLVVDDDPTNRLLARSVLGRAYDVREAASAAEALEVLGEAPVDLVLLDVMMPGESGLDVCPKIKDRYRSPFLPVLMLTALGEPAERVAGLAAGADDFITKPFDARELRLRVAAFLRVREQDKVSRAQLRALHDREHLQDDLVSLLVHDLRNPLAAMLAVIEAGEQDPRPDDFATLHGAVERMRGLVDDILTVRQLEDHGLLARRRCVATNELTRAAVATVTPSARLGEVCMVVEAGTAEVSVDPGLVQRALENLLCNAVRFSPRGSEVRLTSTVGADGLTLTVTDRGPGIDAEIRPVLFDKFGALRGRGARGGHGLGLYLVRLVAEAHGGTICASDGPAGGTAMTLRLPSAST